MEGKVYSCVLRAPGADLDIPSHLLVLSLGSLTPAPANPAQGHGAGAATARMVRRQHPGWF